MMPLGSSKTQANFEPSMTPCGLPKNHSKPPARKLWHNVQLQIPKMRSQKHQNPQEQKWDEISSPQFIDFADLHEIGDSFFGKQRVIVSTPKVNADQGSSAHSFHDNTLIQSLETFSLSGIDHISPIRQSAEDTNEQSIDNTVIAVETNEPGRCKTPEKPLNVAASSAKFHDRDKCKQDDKPERVKKNVVEEKNLWVFRAKPLPKYLKARKEEINKNNNKNAEEMACDIIGKEQKLQSSDKNKKNTEIWKRPPLVPCPAPRNPNRSKSPNLRTKERAEERKRFDDTIKENQTKAQQQKQMELEAKKKQEEEETALLRKQTIIKAQPIRKYKLGLPKVQKRSLTNPQTPMTLKRRRIDK